MYQEYPAQGSKPILHCLYHSFLCNASHRSYTCSSAGFQGVYTLYCSMLALMFQRDEHQPDRNSVTLKMGAAHSFEMVEKNKLRYMV
jgi:hypothetical protein